MAVFRAFYRSFGRMLFVSVLCFACGFLSARAEESRIVPMNTIQLLPMYTTGAATYSPGTGYIYGKPLGYGGGIYDAYSGGNQISSITIPTWSGRSFLGYYSSSSANSTQYIDSVGIITSAGKTKAQENPGNSNQTWYGHWSGTYSLQYNCSTNYNVPGQQGGGTAPTDESYSAGQSVTLQQNQGCYPTDSYYSFGGWNCFNRVLKYFSGGQFTSTDYDSGPINNGYNLTMPYNDVWCEPIWIPSNVTLSYNCGWLPNTNTPVSGSAPSSVSGSVPLGGNLASAVEAQNTCTMDTNTYSFVGWYCPGGAWISDPGGGFSITEDTTCYAVWAENNPCAPGSEASNSPEILGGTISDWNQIQYLSVSLNDLSGMCSETVGSYPGQIGTPSSTSGDYCWCQATSYNSTPLNNYPWVFVQYYNGCNVEDCQSWCLSSINHKDPDYFFNVSLLSNPICEYTEYTLTYDCGVNGTAPAGVTQSSGSNVTLANGCNGALSANYDFQGWYCVSDNSLFGHVYNGNDTYTLYDNTMCTAIWTESNPCDPGFVARQEILGVFDENTFEEQNWTDVSFNGLVWEVPSGSGQTVSLTGMCSNTPGTFGVAGNPTQTGTSADTYCWCQATSYNSTPLNNYPWVYSGFNFSTNCNASSCGNFCAGEIPGVFSGNTDAQELFLQSLFTKNICGYTLTYDCDNGNSAQSALNGGTYEGGNSIGLSDGGNCDAPTGQTFDYWDCDNGIGTPQNNIVNPTPYDNMTCTAHWANIPVPTYSLTYNCNNNGAGGTAPTDSNSPYYAGTTGISLAGNEGSCNPPSNDMVFSDWSCHKENDSSTVFNEGDSMPAYNVVCDAQWEQLYNVVYNCNNNGAGGSAPASQSYFVGDTVFLLTTMPQNTCTAPNMIFDGWDCHKETDNTVPFNSGSAMQAYNVVCDAQWVHRVQYGCGSGTQQPNANVYVTTSDASVILADNSSLCTPAQGYVFYKWSCVSNGGYMYGGFYDSGYNYVFTSPFVMCEAVYREVSCNSGETTVPFVLGQEMTLADWENNSSVWGGYSNITLGDLWNPTSASYSGNSATFSNSSSNWTVTMNGKCSNTWWMSGETGHPSDSPGDHCWCQVGSIVVNNGSGVPLSGYPWVYAGIDATQSSCTTNSCSNICAIHAANAYNYSTDMANFFLQSLYTQNTCVSAPATYKVTYHGGSCAPSALDYQSNPINAGDSYTVENPNCAYANSNSFIPTDDCYEFVGWSEDNPAQVQNPTIGYNNCDNCVTQTGSCGTINSVSANIDLYAICNVKNHSVIYHDCDDTYTYTDSNAVWIGQSPNYTPLSPSGAPLSSSNLKIDPLSSFQGWATSATAGEGKSWCGLESGDLYPELYGGNGKKTKYNYSVSADKLCRDIDLYAVCCPLNLSWILNGGQWPTDPNNQTTFLQNQTSCEYGAIAGQAGSITPLRTPLKPGYTFNGWLVTDYTP